MSETNLTMAMVSIRATLKRIRHRPDVPADVAVEPDLLQQSIKMMLNSNFPAGLPSTPRFRLAEQDALLRQHKAVVQTAQETLSRLLPQLEAMDFRPVKSEADYLMDTVAANVDNEKLSDADFRQFIRNSIDPIKGAIR